MGISADMLMKKLKAFIKTDNGKSIIDDFIFDGVGKKGNGKSFIINNQDISDLCDAYTNDLRLSFIDIYTKAYGKSPPQSVLDDINSLCCNSIEKRKGDYGVDVVAHLVFLNDLGRPSVTREDTDGVNITSSGIDNIIALLNNGYEASRSVFGTWESHDCDIWTKPSRTGMRFMEDAEEHYTKYVYAMYADKGIDIVVVAPGTDYYREKTQ